jgi:hypothetical protein
MRRIHGVELTDLDGYPSLLREAAMAFLRHASERTGQAAQILPIIDEALTRSGKTQIVDLCSGGAGPLLWIANELTQRDESVSMMLTDIYPNQGARELASESEIAAHYEPDPVDARDVPSRLKGLRTIINAFHHFRPDDAQRILASAVAERQPIAVVEVVRRSPWTALAILGTPFHVFLIVPFFRPFRWPWLPLTYLLPVIPLTIFWDAMFSCLRAYSREELTAMARSADPNDSYDWQVEEPRLTGPIRGISLVGIPRESIRPEP